MTSSVELGGKYSTAHSARTGEPCRAHPVHEATVCYWHGGASPQVKKAAARRTGVVTHFQRLGQTRPLRDLGDQSRTYSPQAGKPSSVKGDVLLASALGTQDLRSIFAGTWQSWSKMEQQRYCLLPGSRHRYSQWPKKWQILKRSSIQLARCWTLLGGYYWQRSLSLSHFRQVPRHLWRGALIWLSSF